MSAKSIDITLRLFDKVSGPLKRISGGFENLSKQVGRAQNLPQGLPSGIQQAQNIQRQTGQNWQRSSDMLVTGQGMMALGGKLNKALQTPIDVAMSFEKTMSKVRALAISRLDKSSKEKEQLFQQLRNQALTLGAETSFSASQVGGAQSFMAMAGFKPAEIEASMRGILDLAKAGDMGLQRTADITTNILSGFGLGAEEMGRAGDVLAYTFTSSNTTLSMLGETMKHVAPLARKAGASIEEVAAMTGLLGSEGIQAEVAGTALKSAFLTLANPKGEALEVLRKIGVYERDMKTGRLKSLAQVLKEIKLATADFSDGGLAVISQIFGREAASGLTALVDKSDQLNARIRETKKNTGAAGENLAELAKIMGDNADGKVKAMRSSMESLQITLGDLLMPTFTKGVEYITRLIRTIQDWVERNQYLSKTILTVASYVGRIIVGLGGLAVAFSSVSSATAMLNNGFHSIARRLSLFRIAFVMAGVAVAAILSEWRELLPVVKQHFPELGRWLGEHLPAQMNRFAAAGRYLQQVFSGISSTTPFLIWKKEIAVLSSSLQSIGLLPEWASGRKPTQHSTVQSPSAIAVAQPDFDLQHLSEIALGADQVERYSYAIKSVHQAWQVGINKATPALLQFREQSLNSIKLLIAWAGKHSDKISTSFGGAALAALTYFSNGLSWINEKAQNGSMGLWLDQLLAKLPMLVEHIKQFSGQAWALAEKIVSFTQYLAHFVGGWENLIKIFATGFLIAKFTALLQGLAALGGIIVFLFSPVGLLIGLLASMAVAARWLSLEWDKLSIGVKLLSIALISLGAIILLHIAYLGIAAAAQIAWNAAMAFGHVVMVMLRGVAFVAFVIAIVTALGVATAAQFAWNAAMWLGATAMAIITSPITLVVAAVAALAAGAYLLYRNWDAIKPALMVFWETIKQRWNAFKEWVGELAQSIVDFFAALPAQMLEIGVNIITSLWSGMKNTGKQVTGWVEGFATNVIDSAKGVLGINSPSRAFAEIGQFTVAGMQVGMESQESKLLRYLSKFGSKLKSWWSDVAASFNSVDLSKNMGAALQSTQNTLATLPSPVQNALNTFVPGAGVVSSVAQAVNANTGINRQAVPTTNNAPAPLNKINKTKNPTTAKRWDKAKHDIVSAANKAGVDAGTLANIAHFESMGFNPNARPISKSKPHLNTVRQFDGKMAMSSAHGYGQFIDSTWRGMINKYGKKYGIENAGNLTKKQANKYRTNTKIQAAMLAEFTKENVEKGRKLGGHDDLSNVYALHNLGSGGGAKFLKALNRNPNASVSSVLSKNVINRNASLYKNGNITLKEAYAKMGKKMRGGDVYAAEARAMQNGQVSPAKPLNMGNVQKVDFQANKLADQLPAIVRDLRIKDSDRKTKTLGSMGITRFSELSKKGGQAFEGGYNNPETLYATALIQKGLGKHFNRTTAQNDLYHQKHSPRSGHTKGFKTDFTVKGMSYARANQLTKSILIQQGLKYGTDFKTIDEANRPSRKSTGDHIDFKLTKTGQRKIRNIMLAQQLAKTESPTNKSIEKRASGGAVQAGGFYQVNELGPELVTMQDKTYLMMGHQTGHVTPLITSVPPQWQQQLAANAPMLNSSFSSHYNNHANNEQMQFNKSLAESMQRAKDNRVVSINAGRQQRDGVRGESNSQSVAQHNTFNIYTTDGMTAHDVAAEVERILHQQQRQSRNQFRQRMFD